MAYEQAREFLARVVPWTPGAYVNVHYSFMKEGIAKPLFAGLANKSLDAAVRAVQYAAGKNTTVGIYACMSAQGKAEERTTPTGRKWLSARRLAADAVALKSLYLDIDMKDYPDSKAMTSALSDFLKKGGIVPPSIIVASGGGLHVYWTLNEAIPAVEWKPLAEALQVATMELGFKVDSTCTTDAARILRVPDTLNRKPEYGAARPVRMIRAAEFDYPLEVITKSLSKWMGKVRPGVTPGENETIAALGALPAALAGTVDTDALGAGIEAGKAPPGDLMVLAGECPFVAGALSNGGADLDNPKWNLTTLIATFLEDGDAAAHAMAQGHPGYSAESTQELFERKQREREEKNLGWPRCATVSRSGVEACKGCRHLAENKSPLNFAYSMVVPTATAVPSAQGTGLVQLPPRYSVDVDGYVFKAQVDEAGNVETFQVFPYPVRSVWVQEDPWILNFESSVYKGHTSKVHLPFESVATKEAFTKALFKAGLASPDHQVKTFRDFIMAWMQQLRETRDAVVKSVPFGWSVAHNGTVEGFTYGGRTWTPTGDKPAANPDPVTGSIYSPRGDILPWVDMAKVITNQERPELDAILASAFAAPLVRCTGHSGMMMAAYSMGSGKGKSTALDTAAAVWGAPKRAKQQLNDTSNSVFGKLGELRAIPVYWDELKEEEDIRRFANIIFKVTGGRDKTRMRADTSQRDAGTWQTLLVSVTNDSLVDAVQRATKNTTAGIYRIFEYAVPDGVKGQINGVTVQRMTDRLNENYGQAGLKYAQFLGQNYKRVDNDVEQMNMRVNAEVQAINDERFWTALIAILLQGATYANELQLATIDLDALKVFLYKALDHMREIRKNTHVDLDNVLNLSDVLQQFLGTARRNHTLVTTRIHIGRGRPKGGTVRVVGETTQLGEIWVQVGKEDGLLRMSSSAFSNWCQERGYTRSTLIKRLETEFMVKRCNAILGSGTEYAGMMQWVLEFDCNGTGMKKMFEEL